MVGSASLFACQAASQDVGQGFDAELDEHEGLGNQIGAAAQAGTGAALKVSEACDKDDWGSLVGGHRADFGAKFEAIHARHLNVEEDQIVSRFGGRVQSDLRIFHAAGFEVGLLQRVSDRPARKNLIIDYENIDFLGGEAVGLGATVEKFADEVNGMRDGAQGRGVNVLGLFVKFFEQNFESSGHLGDVMEARDASAARQSVDSAVEFEQRRGPVGFGLGFGEILKSLALGVEGFSARLHEGGEQFVLKLVVV